MKLRINLRGFKDTFCVPRELIQRHIFDCSELQLKSLVMLLSMNQPVDSKELADRLFEDEDKVLEALSYWESRGVSFDGKPNEPKRDSILKGTISRDEVARLLETDKSIRELESECSHALGKPLLPFELQAFIKLKLIYGISLPLIITAIVYARGRDSANINYITTVLLNWNEKGIRTIDEAEREIQGVSEEYRAERIVQKAFGIEWNVKTEQIKEFARKWILEAGFSEEMICLVAEKTLNSIGKVSLPYASSILESWQREGAKTLDDVKQIDQRWLNKTKAKQEPNEDKGNSSFSLSDLDRLITK